MAACRDYEGLIAAAIYGPLDPSEREHLERHLAACPACRGERDELARTARLAGAGAEGLTPAELDELSGRISRAVASLGAPAKNPRLRMLPRRMVRRPRPVPRRRWIAAASVAAALLLGTILLTRPSRPPREREVAAPPAPPAPAPLPPAPEPVHAPTPVAPEERPTAPGAGPVTAPSPPRLPERPESPPPGPSPLLPPLPFPPAPPPAREDLTTPVIARLERFEGKVLLLAGTEERPARSGEGIASGRGILTVGRRSLATVTFPDGTRLEIGPDTRVAEIAEGGPAGGKTARLEKGTLEAEVSRQPADRPMTFHTPEAEARVLGTRLRLSTASGATRLEVEEGRVQLRRKSDGASVEVPAGRRAVAAEGPAPAARPMRSREGLQALYLFQEGRGTAVLDVSGRGLPLDLAVKYPRGVAWQGPGLVLHEPAVLASPGPASRIIEACRASRELTVEAWIRPAREAGDFEGCLAGLSVDAGQRNFALLQGEGRGSPAVYSAWLRTSTTGEGGEPPLKTPSSPPPPSTGLTHLVYARDASGGERIYLNGAAVAAGRRPGDFSGWDPSYRLILGNEATEERPWRGEFRLVALYSRALRPAEVAHHFRLGAE